MPYINQQRREKLDNVVAVMLQEGVRANGDLNYILFKYCALVARPEASYVTYRNYLAELNETAHEIRRRLLVPYETGKIKENGDIL